MKKGVSLIVPVLNEEKNLIILYKEISLLMAKIGLNWQLLFINDGSIDNTQEIIQILAKKDNHVNYIQLRNRSGKALALRAGFREATFPIVITMDGDLQDDPKEIPRFIHQLALGADLVTGWKVNRKDPLSKTIPSKFFNFVTGLLTGVKLHDMNCGFKAYKKEVVLDLNLRGEMHRYIPVLAANSGFVIREIPVHHRPRKYGASKYNWRRLFAGLFDLLTVIYITKFIHRPLHIFGLMGLILVSLGVSIGVYLTFIKFYFGINVGERPLLLLGVLLIIVGVQIGIFGLLAEQLTFMFYKSHHKSNVKSSSIN